MALPEGNEVSPSTIGPSPLVGQLTGQQSPAGGGVQRRHPSLSEFRSPGRSPWRSWPGRAPLRRPAPPARAPWPPPQESWRPLRQQRTGRGTQSASRRSGVQHPRVNGLPERVFKGVPFELTGLCPIGAIEGHFEDAHPVLIGRGPPAVAGQAKSQDAGGVATSERHVLSCLSVYRL